MDIIAILITALAYRAALHATRQAPRASFAGRLNTIMGGGGPGPTDESAPQ